jgi:putative copper export protein
MQPRGPNRLRSQDFHRWPGARPEVAVDSGPVKRTSVALLSILALMLAFAPAALASEGAGLAGPVTDRTVTFFCFGVIAFFAALVIVLSLIQNKLEKRKEQRRSDLARFN